LQLDAYLQYNMYNEGILYRIDFFLQADSDYCFNYELKLLI